jgi:hypothetical protein
MGGETVQDILSLEEFRRCRENGEPIARDTLIAALGLTGQLNLL